jgi:hypothetical protein
MTHRSEYSKRQRRREPVRTITEELPPAAARYCVCTFRGQPGKDGANPVLATAMSFTQGHSIPGDFIPEPQPSACPYHPLQ